MTVKRTRKKFIVETVPGVIEDGSHSAFFGRISDENKSRRAGADYPEEQFALVSPAVEDHGSRVSRRFMDYGSAKRHAARPAFDALLVYLRECVTPPRYLACYFIDRVARYYRDAIDILEIMAERGIKLLMLDDDADPVIYDPRKASHLSHLMREVDKAFKEIADTSRREKSNARRDLDAGKAFTGGVRPKGISADRMGVEPTEAALLRYAARRITTDRPDLRWTDAAAARYLAEVHGWKGQRGGEFDVKALRKTLLKPSNVGVRLDADGAEVPIVGVRETVMSRGLYTKVAAHYGSRRGTQAVARVAMLSGLLTCGLCGAVMWYGTAVSRGQKIRGYACPGGKARRRSCGGMWITAERVEEAVGEIMVDVMSSRRVVEQAARAAGFRDTRRGALEKELAELEEDRQQVKSARARASLDADIARVRGLLDGLPPVSAPVVAKLARYSEDEARRRWAGATDMERAGMVRLVFGGFRIEKRGKGGYRTADMKTRGGSQFDPTRIVPVPVEVTA